MNKTPAFLLAFVLVSAAAFAQTDLQERQHDANANRRSRQKEAIQNADDDNKKEAAEKAAERNKNARERQKNANEKNNDRD